jgi:hypothetical protein
MGGSKKMQQVRSIANRPSGGGNKKQGLPPSIGRPGWLSNFIRSSAGGYFRDIPGPVDPCPTKEITLEPGYEVDTQVQAEALRGVTKIIGTLNITGNVTNLSPFDCLKHITGSLQISDNAEIETISGFGRLTSTDNFFITNNSNLTEITGFGSLTSTKNTFAINNNDILETISGFSRLTSIGNDFAIITNPKLTDASGLWKVVYVGDVFQIHSNTKLNATEFARLVFSLATIGGNIQVYSNKDDDFVAPGALQKWGEEGSKVANTRTLNGKKATEAQPIPNSFGGASTGQPSSPGNAAEAFNLFEVDDNTP